VTSDRNDNTLRLRDGRLLGYAEYGDPKGAPLFYFHGHPGSRVEAELGDATAARQGVRIVGLDRPGYGRSDFKPRRTLLDWPDDVVEAADALGIDRFAVLGASGGGPYAAACAFRIPQRLTAVAVVSGVGPFDAPEATKGMRWQNRVGFGVAGRLPWLARVAMWSMARQVRRSPERVVAAIGRALAEPDRLVLNRPEVRRTFKAVVAEAFRAGSRGAAWDMTLLARPWGFRLEDITMEVHLWQGEEDVLVPPSMGRHLAAAIPNCEATFYPGEGHLLAVDHQDDIQAALVSSGGA
jgi:pimeloyl-ACP methyl ester carboxylesterase